MRTITEAEVAYGLCGDTVNLASRLEAYGGPGRILAHRRRRENLAGRYPLASVVTTV
ncbi:MAG TPA: hypothetical protein VFI59_03600 [Actinomycetota bacterium]|nr:hypothetical protein [Actinomycetota bacterium]